MVNDAFHSLTGDERERRIPMLRPRYLNTQDVEENFLRDMRALEVWFKESVSV